MFCAIVTTIERCKTEGVVNVLQVVKALRVHKPGAVHIMVSGCTDSENHDVICLCIYTAALPDWLFWCIPSFFCSVLKLSKRSDP